ncbi:MAG: S-layer homology domain-containing protein [Clostridia bacterium]|nr:S-layer homology domain-containing protein [Clostridia bacterium]
MKKLFLITSVILMLITSAAFAETEYNTNKLNLIGKLGIITDEIPEPDETVTRAEFARLAVSFMGAKDVYAQNTNEYTDVSGYTEGFEYIYYLRELNIMNGVSDTEFEPESDLTQRQAAIVLARILGYDAVSGDIEAHAAKLRIGALNDNPITYSELVNCFYNALMSDCVIADYDNGYEIKKNYLSEKLGVYEGRGIVTSNSYTSLDSVKQSGEEIIGIGNMELNASDFNIDNLLGYDVRFYYYKENWITNKTGSDKLVYAYPLDSNEVTVIYDYEIDGFDGNKLEYTDSSGRGKALMVKGDADVIYNGIACPDYDPAMLTPAAGKVTYIDNGSDYDCIIIEDYKDYIVTSANDERIYVKNGAEIDLAKFDEKSLQVFDADGNKVKAEDIPQNSVISVYKSADNELLKIYCCVNIMDNAKLTSRVTDEDFVVIDSQKYYVYKLYTDWEQRTDSFTQETYKVYFDYMGKIVRLENDSDTVKYGYLAAFSFDTDREITIIRMVPADGALENFECADRVSVNGSSIPSDKIKGLVSEQQLVCYRTDKDGKIKSIKTAVNSDTFTDSIEDKEINDFKISYRLKTSDAYRKAVNLFGAKVPVSYTTKVFFILEDPEKISDEYYWSGTVSYIDDDTTYRVQQDGEILITGYSTTNTLDNAEAIVIHKVAKASSVSNNSVPAVITNVTTAVNDDDDEARTRLTLLVSSRLIAYNLSPDIEDAGYSFSKGDTIRFAVNKRTYEIDAVDMICDKTETGLNFKYDASKNYSNMTYVGGAVYRVVSGSVYDYDNDILCLSRGDINAINTSKPQFEYYKNVSSAPIYIVEDDRVKIGTPEDIITYKNSDKYQGAIMCTRYSDLKAVILYTK